MISADSRYSASTVVPLDFTDPATGITNTRQTIVSSQQQAFSFTYISHMWTGFDRIDTLAESYFGDATQWWNIADANPEILDWVNITSGTIIRIPTS